MKNNRARVIFLFILVFSLFLACRVPAPVTSSPFVTLESPSHTAAIRASTSTSTPAPTATLQSESETAVVTPGMATAASPRTREQEATLIARFPVDLENSYCFAEGLSPNGKWLATRCGYGDNKVFVVRDQEGKKWVLKIKDFLGQDIPVGRTDTLHPMFWSADGLYLYFAPKLERKGDDERCFYRPGDDYGLFRLNLNWGTWTTLIPPAGSFTGYNIEFSPNGQRYVTDADGVRITEIKTREVTQLNVDGTVLDLLWSPDSLHLTYSVVRCNKQGGVESSWVYVWDPFTKQPELVRVSHEGILFRVESWTSNATLRIRGEKHIAPRTIDIIYVYDIARGYSMFSGTVTPLP